MKLSFILISLITSQVFGADKIIEAGIAARFVTIRAGSFQMGSPTSESRRWNDEDLHSVKLTKDFEIQQTEVTQAQWFWVMGYNPALFKGKDSCPQDYLEINGTELCPNHPVEQVSWNDTQEFIKKLNEGNDGYTYRLPTEAEWEFAARGGIQTAYSFGDDVQRLTDYGWYLDNSDHQTHAVGKKLPNPYGLYDMNGNVWEWVHDFYYERYSTNGQQDPVGPAWMHDRVIRGGSWADFDNHLRSANREYTWPSDAHYGVGFRLVRTSQHLPLD